MILPSRIGSTVRARGAGGGYNRVNPADIAGAELMTSRARRVASMPPLLPPPRHRMLSTPPPVPIVLKLHYTVLYYYYFFLYFRGDPPSSEGALRKTGSGKETASAAGWGR